MKPEVFSCFPYFSSLIIILFISNVIYAQVSKSGNLRTLSKSMKMTIDSKARYVLPAQDNELLIQNEQNKDIKSSYLKPFKFATAVNFPIDIRTGGEWVEDTKNNLRIWRAEISSDKAISLSLIFDEFHLPENSELYIIGSSSMLGAFTPEINNNKEETFSTMPLTGDTLRIEYYERLSNNNNNNDNNNDNDKNISQEKNKEKNTEEGDNHQATGTKSPVRLRIRKVAHGFRGWDKDYQDGGTCNINVACETSSEWQNQIKSVVMLLTDESQRFCSGALINNTKRDGRQLILTAHHCLFEKVDNWIAAFNYQVSSCKGDNKEPTLQTAHGMKLLASWEPSDFALLELQEKIPSSYNAYLSGWDLSSKPPSDVVCIHHPSGDVKKISYYKGDTVPSSYSEAPRTYHWKILKWTKGTTEEGSSGSPLYNKGGLIVGHLHGGQSACYFLDGWDMFGALYYDWTTGPTDSNRLRLFLNPQKSHVVTLRGMSLNDALKRGSLKPNPTKHHSSRRRRRRRRVSPRVMN